LSFYLGKNEYSLISEESITIFSLASNNIHIPVSFDIDTEKNTSTLVIMFKDKIDLNGILLKA